jgi:hypothetical protein
MPIRFVSLALAIVLLVASRVASPADPPALQESAPAVKSALNDVITRQLAAFHAGDFKRAYTFAALEIRSKYDPATFEQMVKIGFPILTRSTSTEFGPTLDDGENGVVYVKVGDAQGEQLYLYSMKREEKDWKIIGVSRKDEEQAEPPSPVVYHLPPDSA